MDNVLFGGLVSLGRVVRSLPLASVPRLPSHRRVGRNIQLNDLRHLKIKPKDHIPDERALQSLTKSRSWLAFTTSEGCNMSPDRVAVSQSSNLFSWRYEPSMDIDVKTGSNDGGDMGRCAHS